MKLIQTLTLVLLLAVSYTVMAQRTGSRSRMLEGTVVQTTGGPRWIGIVVESKRRRYVVSINNSDYPKTDPEVIGSNVESVGTRVRVIYTRMEPWLDDMFMLHATRVVKLNRQSNISKTGQQAYSDWRAFWNAFRVAVRHRDRGALKAMMTPGFEWSHGDTGYRDPFSFWSAPKVRGWAALDGIMAKGVAVYRPDSSGRTRVAPPAAATIGTGYDGWAAYFKLGEDGTWRWDVFVVVE